MSQDGFSFDPDSFLPPVEASVQRPKKQKPAPAPVMEDSVLLEAARVFVFNQRDTSIDDVLTGLGFPLPSTSHNRSLVISVLMDPGIVRFASYWLGKQLRFKRHD